MRHRWRKKEGEHAGQKCPECKFCFHFRKIPSSMRYSNDRSALRVESRIQTLSSGDCTLRG
jgi:hypothetical protein